MEFPSLGKNCFVSTCKQLDFLPMKCDSCSHIFCRDHITYDTHNCPESYKKDNQVPVCPLCNEAISVKKGELPDVVVSRHIDNDCSSDLAKQRRKIYTNKCSHKGCKQKELVPVKCDKCHKNFCLRHRHEADHQCKGFENTGKGISSAGAAAVSRNTGSASSSSRSGASTSKSRTPQKTPLASMGRDLDRERRQREQRPTTTPVSAQAGMSEDEALARALQLSMAENQSQQQSSQNPNRTLTAQEQEDLALAQALAASEQQGQRDQRRRQQRQDKSICRIS